MEETHTRRQGTTGDAPVGVPAGRRTRSSGRQALAGRQQVREPLLPGSSGRRGAEAEAGSDTALPSSVRPGSADQARVSGSGSRRRPRAASRSARRSSRRRSSVRGPAASSVTVQVPPCDVEARGVGLEQRTDSEGSDSSGDRDGGRDRQDSGFPAGGDTAPAQLRGVPLLAWIFGHSFVHWGALHADVRRDGSRDPWGKVGEVKASGRVSCTS